MLYSGTKHFICMSLSNKLDLRLEAAKLVVQLPGTTIENFHERAYRVEFYLTGDAELPEQDSSLDELKKLVQEVKDAMLSVDKPKCSSGFMDFANVPGHCMGLAGAESLQAIMNAEGEHCYSPHGMPSSEGEALFLQQDGEKVE